MRVLLALLLALAFLRRRLSGRAVVDRIYFAPRIPQRRHAMTQVCLLLGARRSRARRPDQRPAMFFPKDTIVAERPAALNEDAVNGGCLDISKERVEAVYHEVFGEKLAVDPTNYSGPYVEKSNANAAHDGRVLIAPLAAPRPDCVYERLVDTRDDDGKFIDLRTCIVGSSIPVVFYIRRSIPFAIGGGKSEIRSADGCFSRDEQRLLLEFSRRMGLDICELDVLRDGGNGRIYVVDAASTPVAPRSLGLSGLRAVRLIADAFAREILNDGTNAPA